MTTKSRHKIGWLSPFLSLLGIGLAKSNANREIGTLADTLETAGAKAVAPAAPAATAVGEPEINEPEAVQTPREVKSIDWEKGRKFQLAARLAVNAQLNRPKFETRKVRKSASATAPAPHWNRSAKSRLGQARPVGDTAVVINFPCLDNARSQLAQAA